MMNTQYNIQIMCYRIVHLNLYNFINQCHLNKFCKKEKKYYEPIHVGRKEQLALLYLLLLKGGTPNYQKEHRINKEREAGFVLFCFVFLKELAHAVIEAEKSKILRIGQQVEITGKGQVPVQPQRPTAAEFGKNQCC